MIHRYLQYYHKSIGISMDTMQLKLLLKFLWLISVRYSELKVNYIWYAAAKDHSLQQLVSVTSLWFYLKINHDAKYYSWTSIKQILTMSNKIWLVLEQYFQNIWMLCKINDLIHVKLNGTFFRKEHCIVVTVSGFYVIYYEEISKSWFSIEILIDVDYVSILFRYSPRFLTSFIC